MSLLTIPTTFNNRPAPGGQFDTDTKTYVKVCRAENAGFHPYNPHLGGIDSNVIEIIKLYGCQSMKICTARGDFKISFNDFMKYGYKQKWKDSRFPYPRYYCPIRFWENDKEEKAAPGQAVERVQASLFNNNELQTVARVERFM